MTTNRVLVKQGTEIVFGVTASFAPADDATNMATSDAITDVFTLASLADTAGRQSDKVDLGAVRAAQYAVYAAIDLTDETPVQDTTFDFYWLPSTSATQANGNIAGNSGADAAAPGGALGSLTLGDFKRLGQFIGVLQIHDGAVVQNGLIGVFSPDERWGQMLVINESGDLVEADDVENHVVMKPIEDDIQAAA